MPFTIVFSLSPKIERCPKVQWLPAKREKGTSEEIGLYPNTASSHLGKDR
jgi:hypothetical protein